MTRQAPAGLAYGDMVLVDKESVAGTDLERFAGQLAAVARAEGDSVWVLTLDGKVREAPAAWFAKADVFRPMRA